MIAALSPRRCGGHEAVVAVRRRDVGVVESLLVRSFHEAQLKEPAKGCLRDTQVARDPSQAQPCVTQPARGRGTLVCDESWTPYLLARRLSGREAGLGAVEKYFSLKLGNGAEDVEDESAAGDGRVDGFGEAAELDPTLSEFCDLGDEVGQ